MLEKSSSKVSTKSDSPKSSGIAEKIPAEDVVMAESKDSNTKKAETPEAKRNLKPKLSAISVYEYNKRKDVLRKTILRKCRRELQEEFNALTGYFPNRKLHGHQFFKDCLMQFTDSLTGKPEQLDVAFAFGAMLYPQEMSKAVD